MSLARIERYLESHGWTRQVAGDADFDAAFLAIEQMAATGKGLIVSGEYGVGKTALASLAARAFGGGVFKVRLAIPDDLDRLTRSWQEYYLEDAASDKSEFYESELYVCSPTMQEVERAAIADAKRYIEEDRI